MATRPGAVPAAQKSAASNGNGAKGLSYLEKKELGGIEAAIEAAEAGVAALEAHIAAPEFYAQSSEAIRAKLAEVETAKANATALYRRWQELEARAKS